MGRAHISTNAPYNFLHFSQQYTVHIMAWRAKKSTWIFSCARVRIRFNEFSPSNICLHTIAATLRTGVTARISCGYIFTQDRRKRGSNRHRWRDTAMIQSALIICTAYITQTNSKPTTAHYFATEKCVNVHKSPMKKCDE